MSGVILRCPNCGTTRTAPGECEACHEGQVRYYCTMHTPGRWLDTPACPQCGARFGEPMAGPVVRPVPAAPARKPVPAPRAAPRPLPEPERRPAAGAGPSRRPKRSPPVADAEVDARDEYPPRAASWLDLLDAARARRAPRDVVFERETASPFRPRLGGCLGRVMLILLFLFFALTSSVISFF